MPKLYASAARNRITPPDTLREQWNTWSPKKFSPPQDDIYVQALVFSDKAGHTLVHVGGDLIMTFGAEFREKILEQFSLPASCLFFSCTHNHMVPGLSSPRDGGVVTAFGGGPGSKEWTEFVYTQTLAAIHQAMDTLRPARIGAGHGCSGISVNREWDTPVGSLGTGDRNGDTIHEIGVLRVDQADGTPVAVLMNYNAHAGSFFGGNIGLDHRITGGDVAAYVSEFVGNAIGHGCVPVWAIGGAGDQNTYFHSGMMWPAVDDVGNFTEAVYVMDETDAVKLARNAAAIQALEALDVYHNIKEFSYDFNLKTGIVYKPVRRRKEPREAPPAAAGGVPVARTSLSFVRPGNRPRGNAPGVTVPKVNTAEEPDYEEATLRFYLVVLNGIAFAGANSESFIGLKKAVLNILPYEQKFYIDMNFDSKAEHAGYVPAPRYDSHYDNGRRNNLQGLVMPYNGNDTLRAYTDGFTELVQTIA